MEFRPCIDLHAGKVKQIVGSTLKDGDNSAQINFESGYGAAYYADLYRRDNLRGGHVIKLGPGNDEAARQALQTWPDGLQIGGGITPDNARDHIAAGASHVIVTSCVFRDGVIHWNALKKLSRTVGPRRLVLDLSCVRKEDQWIIVTNRWQQESTMTVNASLLEELAPYCDEYLVHAAGVEGKMAGPDEELIAHLARYAPRPVTYAGGIATMEHVQQCRTAGSDRVHITIGSALDIFGGPLSYNRVVSALKENPHV
ncbi:MAG: phosphoribosylformimino-5-aminoimidazole carboxamide ribotide isomerase [Fibrobacterota bacterium]